MRRLAILVLLSPLALATVTTARADATVRFVDFDAIVTPVTALRILDSIEDATAAGDDLVLVRLDTPGGTVEAMEDIVRGILASDVPVAVWVGPSGAKAASAGFYILLSADVAAMAPGTRTGAASVVMIGGDNDKENIVLEKATEDAAALLRSIAGRRGRNREASQDAVFEAKAYEETEAKELGLIDLVAPDVEALLAELDGREVTRFDGTTARLETTGARLVETEFGYRHRFMELLGTPAVALILFLLGALGIYVELTTPGVVLPGVVGALCLLLFFLSAQILPISVTGALLILLALVMFLLEIKVASFGMLTLGGVVSLLIGSWMLVDGPIPALRVPPSVFVPACLVIAGLAGIAVLLAIKAQRGAVRTGEEGMLREIGTATEDLDPSGKVFVHGELWSAATAGPAITRGSRVRIVAVDRMELRVAPADGASDAEAVAVPGTP